MFLVPQLFRRNEEFKTFYQSGNAKKFSGYYWAPWKQKRNKIILMLILKSKSSFFKFFIFCQGI